MAEKHGNNEWDNDVEGPAGADAQLPGGKQIEVKRDDGQRETREANFAHLQNLVRRLGGIGTAICLHN